MNPSLYLIFWSKLNFTFEKNISYIFNTADFFLLPSLLTYPVCEVSEELLFFLGIETEGAFKEVLSKTSFLWIFSNIENMKLISDWNLFSCCLPRTEDIESPGCTPLKTQCNIVSFRSSSSLSPLSVHSRPEAAKNKEQKMSCNIMTSSQSLVCYYEMENATIRIRNIFMVQ